MRVQDTPRVSVIIPTYQGEAWITECLDSLAAQTLPWSEFEAVVIQNGPPTRTPELVEAWRAAHPGFRLQLLESDTAGVSRARNLGLEAARGAYVTFLDDDDQLAPATLEAMLAKAAPDVVVATTAGFVADDDFSRPNFSNWYALALLRYVGRPTWNRNLSSAFTTTWGKLVDTELARGVGFDERLTRIGEDRVFWLSVLAARQLRVELLTAGAAAAVLYRVRQDSLSVRADSLEDWDRDVTPWLDTAEIMHDIVIDDRETELMRHEMVTAVVGVFLNSWLRTHPDETARIDEAIRERDLEHFRPEALRTNRARELAVVGLTPGTDAAGVPLGEALRARGEITDLIAYVSEDEAVAESVLDPVREVLDQSMAMSGPAVPTWSELGTLVDELLGQLGPREARKPGPYLRLLSRSAGPIEHLIAGCVKLSRPDLPWVAETVSAPAGAAVVGVDVRVESDELSRALVNGLVRAGFTVETMPRDVEGLARLLMLGLADEIVFESAELRDEALARCESGAIARRALDVVSPRPAHLAGLPAAVRRRLNDGTATELAVLGSRDEVLVPSLVDRETVVDVCVFPPTGTGAATITAAVEPVLDQLITVELGPITWGLVGPLADAVLQAGARIEEAKGASYRSVRSCSTEPLEHLIGAMVRLALPEASWVAEFGPADRRTTDVAVEGDQALNVLAAGVIEAGFAITEVPDEMSGLAELVAFALADEVVFAGADDRDAALGRCPVAAVRERAERVARVRDDAPQPLLATVPTSGRP